MSSYDPAKINAISRRFHIYGDLHHVEPCKIGHINETYIATYFQGGTRIRYVHQRLNTDVFRNPDAVMDNILRVTRHQRSKLEASGATDISRRVLTVVPADDGRPLHRTASGEHWRTFVFVEGVRTFESVESPAQAYQAGLAFGRFQAQLADLPRPRLAETIPHFHDSRRRFDALLASIKADSHNRGASAGPEIAFALERQKWVDVILRGLAKGTLPERVTHNDSKFNNVMLDSASNEAVCVVDLDTVMPGCALYDFGDMVRTTTSPTLEDELDLSKVHVRMPLFKKLCQGYLDGTGPMLNKHERALIAFSGKLLTFTIGLRFLTDYLGGDTYFRVHRPNHNLDRARTQFRLVESIERNEEAMQRFADSLG
jgi:aminoglycoside phosphotransferase (APT) family kinase protein